MSNIGIEYPMISFNYGRPNPDGSYDERTKRGMIGVITHEIGHNFFPMIVNSDERQWTWMDEGLNSFVETLAELDYDPNFFTGNLPKDIVPYMGGDQSHISPIMSQGDYVHQFGPNAYTKPAAGLYMLRHTIMGPELFDYAFRTYSQRWMFRLVLARLVLHDRLYRYRCERGETILFDRPTDGTSYEDRRIV